MIAIISIKAANITVILGESRDMCVSPFSPNKFANLENKNL